MRMLTAIFGLPCPIGLPNTSSALWPLPAPVGTELARCKYPLSGRREARYSTDPRLRCNNLAREVGY